jgi:Leucine-rich repeat (LRR) protein
LTKKSQELWISELFQWADDNNIPELQYYEDIWEEDDGELIDCSFWVGLPREREVLLNLEDLNLSWHNCCEIPSQIRHLTKLKKFSFAKRHDGLMPDFYDISEGPNKIKQIPNWISELVTLEMLDLSGNGITIVPNSIGKLKNLKRLYLHENEIWLVAKTLGQLNKLEVLWIQDNQLFDLLYQLNDADALWLQDNVLNSLAANIVKLKSLIELWFDCRISPNEPMTALTGNLQGFFKI